MRRIENAIDPKLLGLDVRSWSGVEAHCLCPFHSDSRPSSSFNTKTGSFICFACGAISTAREIANYMGTSVGRTEINTEVESSPIWHTMVDHQLAIGNKYLHSRGVTDSMIEEFNIIDTPIGVGFPMFDHYQLCGFTVRTVDRKGAKYIVVGRKPPIWPMDKVDDINNVVVVEGIFGVLNGLRHGVFCVATLGANIGSETIDSLKGKRGTVVFDDDEAGARGMRSLVSNLPSFNAVVPGREMDEANSDFWSMVKDKSLSTTKDRYTIYEYVESFRQ